MLKNKLKYLALVLAGSMFYSAPANAIGITFSEKTNKNAAVISFRGGANLPLNLGLSAGIEYLPSYSAIVGDFKSDTGAERWSMMGNGDITLNYNWNLLDAKTILGDFNPTLSPYVGYKHFFSHTGTGGLALDKLEPTTSFSSVGGVKYGLRFASSLPLGFHVFAEGGATTLLKGTWSQNKPDSSGTIDGNGLMLPHAGVGASFNLLNIFTLRAGYNILYFPDIRNPSAPLSLDSRSMVHSIDLGASLLFFSI